ncbi:MAG: hypothetical protein CMJ64_21910 [Planctomycetaceae bacterium]|nr:hypothetical protein [Planctomycetaceae bacterium]
MFRRVLLSVVLIASVVLLSADPADAIRRRRRNNNYQYYSTGYMRVAPTMDDESTDYHELAAYYDYDRAGSEEVAFSDKIRVFLMLHDPEFQNDEQQMVAEVKLTDMSMPETTHALHYPVTLTRRSDDEYTLGVIDVMNDELFEPFVKPGTVYRLFVNLHRKSANHDAESALGRVPTPYYVATSGESAIEQARQHIVMRTFREWYRTQRGWSRSSEYVMDCHDYYRWATGSCTVGASYGRANIERLFGGRYSNGGHIKALTEETPIHADYVRIPGHTFMLLAYDPEWHEVLTMEGNFGSSIAVVVRSVGSGWTVGHLKQEHLRPDLFTLSESDEEGADATASRERGATDENTEA